MQPQCYKTKFLSVNTLTLAHTRSLVTSGVLSEAPQKCFRALHATHTRRGRCSPTAVTQIHLYLCPQRGEGVWIGTAVNARVGPAYRQILPQLWCWFCLWLFGLCCGKFKRDTKRKMQNACDVLQLVTKSRPSKTQTPCEGVCVRGNCYTCSGSTSPATWQENYLSRHSFSAGIKFSHSATSARSCSHSCASSCFVLLLHCISDLLFKRELGKKKERFLKCAKKSNCVNWERAFFSFRPRLPWVFLLPQQSFGFSSCYCNYRIRLQISEGKSGNQV